MRHFAIAIVVLAFPITVFAKTEKECRGQGNRLFYARCMNAELEKRPVVHVLPHRMAETPCLGKAGQGQADCMKYQTRLRRDARREQDLVCDQLKGIAKRFCDTGLASGSTLNLARVVPEWKSTRKKYTKPERVW